MNALPNKLILIADSGSTKTDWLFINKLSQASTPFKTKGLNPNILSDEGILQELLASADIVELKNEHIEIYFYGSGCGSIINKERVKNNLQSIFTNAIIQVESDLVGAVNATCGNQAGIVAILGTGSNSCFFDGENIFGDQLSLGYILGDEGSGSYFGKILLRDFLYALMPEDLMYQFNIEYAVSRDEVINRVYKQPYPNEYIASFLPFLNKHKEHPYCKSIITSGFEDFLKIYILRFPKAKNLQIHFVGSVAMVFENELKQICDRLKLAVGAILRSPIEALAEYHNIIKE